MAGNTPKPTPTNKQIDTDNTIAVSDQLTAQSE